MRGMKRMSRTGVFVAVLIGGIPAEAQNTTPPYTLAIEGPESPVEVGKAFAIVVTQHNTSKKSLTCGASYDSDRGVDILLEYVVRDENATKLQPKGPEVGKINSRRFVRALPCTLAPGETTTFSAGLISNLYDFGVPGRYTVQVLDRIVEKDNKVIGWVRSNVITVTVIE